MANNAALPNYEWQVFPAPDVSADTRTWTYRAQALLNTAPPANKSGLPKYEWQLPSSLWPQKREPQYLDSWTWSYKLTLIGRDRLPTGKQLTDLQPKSVLGPLRARDIDTWAAWYNLKLIGKDRFPPGVQPGNPVLLLTPIGPREPFRSWSLGLVQSTLQPAALPPGETLFDLPPRPPQRLPDYTFADWYNLTLIGQDRLPVGEQITDLPPRDPRELRSWTWQQTLRIAPNFTGFASNDWTPPLPLPTQAQTWTANPATLRVAAALPPGENVYDLVQRPYARLADYTWTDFYNLTLIGQDQLPVGDQRTDRPAVPPFLRDWAQSLTTSTLFTVAMPPGVQVDERPPVSPFYRDWAVNFALTGPTPFTTYNFDWPLPGRAPLPVPSWASWFNLNLRGQDFLPVGDRLYDRPVLLPVEPATRTWTLWLNLTTLNTPVGEQYFERPVSVAWLRDWSLNLQQTTLAPSGTPFLNFDWPVPKPPPLAVGQASSFPLTLIGQDKLPTGEQVSDLPPQPVLRPENLRSWIENTNLALLTVPAVPPIRQYDWPVPPAFRQGALGQTSSYLATLVGQDQLPTGVNRYDLAPTGIKPTDLRSWIWYLSQALTALNFPNGIQVDDLPPRAPQPGALGQTTAFPLELIGADQLPTGVQRYDLAPRGALPTDYRSWVYYTSLALNNSLGVPVGEQLFELAPRAPLAASDLRTWVDRTKLALLVPFNQLDWPVPLGPLLPQRGVASFPSLALTSAVAPFAQTDWPLPVPLQTPQRTFTASFPLSLIGQDQFPPGRQVSELSPFGYPYPSSLRTGTVSPAVPPIVVVTAGGETLLMMGMG